MDIDDKGFFFRVQLIIRLQSTKFKFVPCIVFTYLEDGQGMRYLRAGKRVVSFKKGQKRNIIDINSLQLVRR